MDNKAYDFSQLSPLMVLNGIFGVTKSQLAFQFWFVHDLILTFLIYPALKFCLDRFPYLFLFLLFIFWLSPFEPIIFFRIDVLFFFVLGGVIANYDSRDLFSQINQPSLRLVLPIIFILALSARAWTFLMFSEDSTGALVIRSGYYLAALRLLGVSSFAIWLAWAQKNAPQFFRQLVNYSSYSFLIFAIHYPVIAIIRSLAAKIVPDSSISMAAAGFLIPSLTIACCLLASITAKKLIPRPVNFLAGNRLKQLDSGDA